MPVLIDDWTLPLRSLPTTLDASAAGNKSVVEYLIKAGSNPSVIDIDGRSPLHCATANKKKEIISLLLSHGCKTSLKDKYGKTAADIATALGDDVALHLLTAADKVEGMKSG